MFIRSWMLFANDERCLPETIRSDAAACEDRRTAVRGQSEVIPVFVCKMSHTWHATKKRLVINLIGAMTAKKTLTAVASVKGNWWFKIKAEQVRSFPSWWFAHQGSGSSLNKGGCSITACFIWRHHQELYCKTPAEVKVKGENKGVRLKGG